MKFQLIGAWATNVGLVPAGTCLDDEHWCWHGMPLSWPPPINAACCDQAAYEMMVNYYPPQQILIAGYVPSRRTWHAGLF
jgi:hypothetical protein